MTALIGTLSKGELALPSAFTAGDGSSAGLMLGIGDTSGTFSASGVIPIYPESALSGTVCLGFDQEYMGKILVVPREIDLGTVLTDQVHTVEVWNNSSTAKILTGLTVSGDPGTSVTDLYGLPTHYPVSESRTYDVTVDKLGPPTVDATVLWTFSPAEAGTDCYLYGIRIILFSPPPNWGRDVEETLSYLTDVLTSWDGHEQRVQLIEHPRHGLSYACLVHDTAEYAYLQSSLFGWHARTWGVPWWPDAVPLAANAATGATSFYCDTTGRSFAAGDMVALWVSTTEWESLEISSVAADHVVTVTPCLSAYVANYTRVVPVRCGKLANDTDFDLLTPAVAEFDVSFDCSEEER